MALIKTQNLSEYGTHYCSCGCGKLLIGWYDVVCNEDDDVAKNWRSFLPAHFPQNMSLEDIMKNYKKARYYKGK